MEISRFWNGILRISLGLVVLCLVAGPALGATTSGKDDAIADEVRAALKTAMSERLKEVRETKNAADIKNKRGTYSRDFRKVDDATYQASMNVDTAGDTKLTTERFLVTLEKSPDDPEKWVITKEELQDTYDGLRRQRGGRCSPFQTFSFDQHGMKMSASNGGVCEYFYEGGVQWFIIMSDDLAYEYTAPDYQDYYSLQRINELDFKDDIYFDPKAFEFGCDPVSCAEILDTAFTGLDRGPIPSPEELAGTEVSHAGGIPSRLSDQVAEWNRERAKDEKENPFFGFRSPDWPGNRWYWATVRKAEQASISTYYDNWGGFEVMFNVEVNWPDVGHVTQPVFGYYTEETLANTEPYDLEQRDDYVATRVAGFPITNRWFDVHALAGTVEAALDDPEMLKGEIDYGITVKHELRELPFSIAGIPRQGAGGGYIPPPLYVNSIQSDGEELTWVKTGSNSGIVILPEPVPAGTRLNLSMDFSTRAIKKINHAFSQMARFGWMPFVRFGDFIDDFELTIKTPAKYKILGIGEKVSEKRDGETLITHWKAENPVVFPTIIFGKYESDTPGDYEAKKLDGTPIPVEVHVDEVSMGQLDITVTNMKDAQDNIRELTNPGGSRGIRGKQLRPIATQAAVAINIFNEISGLDYPYGELNLVNDPAPAMYGQAPSSLIYLGSLVFRGEGTMAGGGLLGGGAGSTGTAKFLKSVVAHEVGHQWWGSRIANANQRNYWFVETLAEYFSAIYLERVFGPKEYQEQVDEWRNVVLTMDQKSSVQNASALFAGTDGFGSYQAAVYNKGPYAFHILRKTFGDEKFFPFLKEFSQELAKKGEIVTRDIQQVAERTLGGVDENGNPYNVDLEWFFDQWIRGVGIPEYRFLYEVRPTEDGGAIVEGTIEQRVVVGNRMKKHVLENTFYRAVVPITVIGKKGQEYQKRLLIESAETPFRLKVPEVPLEVVLDKYGDVLSHDVVVNKSW